MRGTVLDSLLANLKEQISPFGKGFLPKEKAYSELKRITGKDFGYDGDAWKAWIDAHPRSISADTMDRVRRLNPDAWRLAYGSNKDCDDGETISDDGKPRTPE